MNLQEADEPILQPMPQDPLCGVEGWLGIFAFQVAANLIHVVWITLQLNRVDYILWNLLSLSIGSLMLLTLFLRSGLFFAALYTSFVLRIGFPLHSAWVHWQFVHNSGDFSAGYVPYETLAFTLASVATWMAYFKLSRRVLVTFGRNL